MTHTAVKMRPDGLAPARRRTERRASVSPPPMGPPTSTPGVVTVDSPETGDAERVAKGIKASPAIGQAIQARRVQIWGEKSISRAARFADVAPNTWRRLEEGNYRWNPKTLATAARTLQWPSDFMRRLKRGEAEELLALPYEKTGQRPGGSSDVALRSSIHHFVETLPEVVLVDMLAWVAGRLRVEMVPTDADRDGVGKVRPLRG